MALVLFTKGHSAWSKLICSVLDEPYSHVSVCQDGFVYHSDLLGVRREPFNSFAKRQSTIVPVEIADIPDITDKYAKYDKSWYDVGAGLFIGFSFLARKYLRIPLPKSNLWQSNGTFICTEWSTEALGEVDSMITPYGLFLQLGGTAVG